MSGKLDAMALNERLFVAGLLDEFEEARMKWNEEKLRNILSEVNLPDYDIELLNDHGQI